jgi:hypothetical protein
MKVVSIVKKVFVLFALALFWNCNDAENWEYIGTERLRDDVFVERFYKSFGAHAGGSQKYFVTDSLTYRFSLGICDDKEYLTMKIDSSTLIVEKHSRRNLKDGRTKIIETKIYQLQ